jgi:hypothetical protein
MQTSHLSGRGEWGGGKQSYCQPTGQAQPSPPPPHEREISVSMSSRSTFLRALKKFAFPRARVPKTPGTRERGNAGM